MAFASAGGHSWGCKARPQLTASLYSVGHSIAPIFIPGFTSLPHHPTTIFCGSWELCAPVDYSTPAL